MSNNKMECKVCNAKVNFITEAHMNTKKHIRKYAEIWENKNEILDLILIEKNKEKIEQLIIKYNFYVNKYKECKDFDNFVLFGSPTPP
jgi:hypothetical protein